MVVFVEINPPRVDESQSEAKTQDDAQRLLERSSDLFDSCGGVLVTDSVLGRQRQNPVQIGTLVKKSHPRMEAIASMRTADRTFEQSVDFASCVCDSGMDGVLAVKGDPGPGGDSGLTPSAAAGAIKKIVPTYLSLPSYPNFAKIYRKVAAHPSGFFTQVVSDTGQVSRIRKHLPGSFRIIPCVMAYSERNAPSAELLNLDWQTYPKDTAEFAGRVYEIAGDILLTSPRDMNALIECAKSLRL